MNARNAALILDHRNDLPQIAGDQIGRERIQARAQGVHCRIIDEQDDGKAELLQGPDLPRRFHGEPLRDRIEEDIVVNDVLTIAVLHGDAEGEGAGAMAFEETGGAWQALVLQPGNKGVQTRGMILGDPEVVMVLCQVAFIEAFQLRVQIVRSIEIQTLF